METPTNSDFQRAYELMTSVKQMAPWDWMDDSDFFGVENPDNRGEIGFVSVMGGLGEYFGISVYIGAKAFFQVIQMYADTEVDPFNLLLIHHLQATFEDRETLTQKDRDSIKAAGFQFRGRKSWPLFRTINPGCYPWYVNRGELNFISCALEQLLDVAPRVTEDKSILGDPNSDDYLIRVPRREGDTLIWEDQTVDIRTMLPEVKIRMAVDMDLLDSLASNARRCNAQFELGFFPIQKAIQERKDEAPFFPYVLMLVDHNSSAVLGFTLTKIESSLEETWGKIPQMLLECLERVNLIPAGVIVDSEIIAQILSPLSDILKMEVRVSEELEHTREVQDFLSGGIFDPFD